MVTPCCNSSAWAFGSHDFGPIRECSIQWWLFSLFLWENCNNAAIYIYSTAETSLPNISLSQDLPRSPVAPPLDSCFLRPARPANRRPPSRWAAHTLSSSPKWDEASKRRCTFPPPGHQRTILEDEEPA